MFSNLYLEKSLNAAKASIGIIDGNNTMDVGCFSVWWDL